MGTVNTPLIERAKSIFTNLGYAVTGDGSEFSAKRDWKVVRVMAATSPDELAARNGDEFYCYVTTPDTGQALHRRLQRIDPDYEWAILTVGQDTEYVVLRAPPAGR